MILFLDFDGVLHPELNTALTTFGDNCNKAAAEAKIAECAAWLRDGLRVVASIDHSNYDPRDLYPR